MFSLCIATMNRYEKFLKKYLPYYLDIDLVDEIIITDENGKDIECIQKDFQSSKLKLFQNTTQLGPFLNKLKAMKLAKNDWIVIIDSDNFADKEYFVTANNYILSKNLKNETILAPSFAKPNFNYTIFSNTISTKSNMKELTKYNKPGYSPFTTLMNTGNYIIHKYLVQNINIEKENDIIPKTSACDVIYFNTLLIEQFANLEIHIVSNLEYTHVVHDDSIYIRTHKQYPSINTKVHERFYKCILN
jgi:hypothetical protein